MEEKHIICVMNWQLLAQSLYEVKTSKVDLDKIGYFLYLGLDEKSGLPISAYANTCIKTDIKNTNFIKAHFTETPYLDPAAIVVNSNVQGLISEPVQCSKLIEKHTRHHSREDTLKQFENLRSEFAEFHMSKLLNISNPASLILF